MNRTVGMILIVLGLVIIAWGAVGFKTRDTVVDVGPIHATKDTEHHLPYAPIIGGLVLVGGAVMLATGRK